MMRNFSNQPKANTELHAHFQNSKHYKPESKFSPRTIQSRAWRNYHNKKFTIYSSLCFLKMATQIKINTGQSSTTQQINANSIENKLKSKQDWFSFLKYQYGYYLPSYRRMIKRFHFVARRKLLLKSADVRPFNIPQFQELSVRTMIDLVREDKDVVRYLNYYPDDQRLPKRKYFFTVLGTLYPEYVTKIVAEANRKRHNGNIEEEKDQKIEITQTLLDKIQREPFFTKSNGRTLDLLKIKSKKRQVSKKRSLQSVSQSLAQFKTKVRGKEEEKMDDEVMSLAQTQHKRKFCENDQD